jgi:UPF0755 protein
VSQFGFGDDRDHRDDPHLDDGHLDEPAAYDEDEGFLDEEPERPRRRRRRLGGCLPVLLVLAIIGGGIWFGGRYAYDAISTRLAPAPDYAGPGTGQVLYQVKQGENATAIARDLKKDDVIKSVDAFTEAARGNDKVSGIQVGYYQLKKQMKASEALAVLVDPTNMVQSLVVVPEGARVRQITKTIVAKTDITKKAVTAALKNPKALGLPAEAKGNPEGYLFPATYNVAPDATALSLLKQMVAKTVAVEQDLDIATKARALGYSPEQILTIASILEYEANRDVDYPKVARVLYNRLDKGMPLQLDSTVSYVSGRSGDVWTTAAERSSDSLYNTYAHTGLPPGPIGSPGEKTIEAALNPAQGPWLYFVPDYQAKTTRFSSTLAEHNKWVAKLKEYCRTSQDC